MTKKRSNFILNHKKITVLVGILLLLVIAIASRLAYEHTVVSDMRAIADEFKSNSKLLDQRDYIVQPSIICVGDEPCPMFDRSWRVKSPLSSNEIVRMLTDSNIDTRLTGTCDVKHNASGQITLCSTKYQSKGYTINLTYDAFTYDRSRDSILMRITRDE